MRCNIIRAARRRSVRRLIAQFCVAFPELVRALGDRDAHRVFFDEAVQAQHIQARRPFTDAGEVVVVRGVEGCEGCKKVILGCGK
jgi:hypothetical protein